MQTLGTYAGYAILGSSAAIVGVTALVVVAGGVKKLADWCGISDGFFKFLGDAAVVSCNVYQVTSAIKRN